MHGHDVGVAKAGEDAGFIEKALGGTRARDLGTQHFNRNVPLQYRIVREEHRAHAAASEFPFYLVLRRQLRRQLFTQRRHRYGSPSRVWPRV